VNLASGIVVVGEVDAVTSMGSPLVSDAGFSIAEEAEKVEELFASCAGRLLKVAWLMVERGEIFSGG
jgi:hypothetical protein